MKKNISRLNRIVLNTIDTPYAYGTNDCNILVIKVIDLFCGTQYLDIAYGKYDTIRKGINLLKRNGFMSIEELVLKHADEVTTPIFGDIWIDGLNTSLILHNHTWIALDHENLEFKVERFTEQKGKFYRIRK